MTQQLAEAAGSWRNRVAVLLVLAIAAMATVFALQDAKATVPSTTITVTDDSPVSGGETLTYTINFAFSGGNETDPAQFVFTHDTDLTFLSGTGTNGPIDFSADCTDDGTTTTCLDPDADNAAWADGAVTLAYQVPGAGATISPPASCTLSDGDTPTENCDLSALAEFAAAAGATGAGEVVALGQENTVTFTINAGITYCSDPSTTPGDPRAFTAADQTVTGLNVQSTTPDANPNNATGTHTVVVTDDATPGGDVTLSLQPVDAVVDGSDCFPITVTLTAANFVAAELRHMSDVDLGDDVEVIGDQHVLNNVRGSRHVVCAVAQNTGIDVNGDGDFTDAPDGTNDPATPGDGDDVPAMGLFIPLGAISEINIQAGGGYLSTTDDEPTQSDLQIFVGDGETLAEGGNGGLLGATCFSWVSTGAGDQEINVVYTGDDGSPYNVSWDTDGDANDNDAVLTDGVVNTAVIKEWNVLEASQVNGGTAFFTTRNNVATGGSTLTLNIPAFFNPATSVYQFTDLELTDVFVGSHTTRTGAKVTVPLAGVNWTAALVSGCGVLDDDDDPNTAPVLSGTTMLASDGSVFNNPSFELQSGIGATGCTSLTNQILIRFTGTEPGPLGSGPGVTVTQDVLINLIVGLPPVKQVILAWAGQRVMVEHDWRLPPGDEDGNADGDTDDDDPDPLGECPFGDGGDDDYFLVQHLKGSGPGNFLSGTHVSLNGSDQADVTVETEESQTDDEVPSQPWENCISRVIYESEDQGQVDIELFVYGVHAGDCNIPNGTDNCPGGRLASPNQDVPRPEESNFDSLGDNQTKVAIVIYYMKLNTVNVALIPGQNKGVYHNATNRDFAPGNPWDASTDVTDINWNVSADILVRGRVTGWFTNSNPSGRPADDSDPNNILPANRWVMPDDWARLQGGACGFECRPEYDYMFANGQAGIALVSPEGTGNTQVATTLAGSTTTTLVLTTAAQTPPGATIAVGTATVTRTVLTRTGNVITVAALTAAPAAGTPVFLIGGTPFEGPISLLDIPGLAAAGLGGAALSDWDPNNIKDTILGDRVLDWFDAPMPPTPVWVDITGAGFIKQVWKQDVYYNGAPNALTQTYGNPYYITDIPESPFLPARVAGGGFLWDTWGLDGPGGAGQGVYRYWNAVLVGTNPAGSAGQVISTALAAELANARTVYGDTTIARRLTVFSDNHGEFMVIANGDANLTYDDCDTNLYSGAPHCAQGDVVGVSTLSATADYPDFRGKHFPVSTNTATVNWTWGGYKEITVEEGETEQFQYIVLHVLDRDGFCQPAVDAATGRVSLHPVLGELVEWLIDSDEGGVFVDAEHEVGIAVTNEDADTTTYSTAETGHTHKEFPTLHDSAVECQSWVKVSNSLLGRTNVFVIANDPEGDIGFDVIIDFTDTITYTLNFRWSLITWAGADGISPVDALSGTGANEGGTSIISEVTAMYGWQQASQTWLAFFPDGVGIPGVNDLTALQEGDAYWIAIRGPNSITWTVVTDVN